MNGIHDHQPPRSVATKLVAPNPDKESFSLIFQHNREVQFFFTTFMDSCQVPLF
jgi:hypothetical protein